MGFLDHSTNNIIVDAVLTTKGRELLADNDNSFSVSFFALGDDEVDYNIIKQFGRTVGKEKIEKNTPVQEAVTNGEQALKYKLFSLAPRSLGQSLYFPIGSFSGEDVTNDNIVNINAKGSKLRTRQFTFNLAMFDNSSLPNSLRQGSFEIIVDGNLLNLNSRPEFTFSDGTVAYELRGSSRGNDRSKYGITLSVSANRRLSNTSNFNVYRSKNQIFIRTYVTVRHKFSGISKNLEIKIYETAAT
jgi:hypothetical protein